MEEIILKELTHEPLTSAERLQLDRWLSKSAANRKLYHQMRLSLISPAEAGRRQLRAEIWEDILQRMERPQYAVKRNERLWPVWLKVAAVFIAGLGCALGLYKMLDRQHAAPRVVEVKLIEKMSMPGQKVTTRLPDGTLVKLNADSRLIVPEMFSGTAREVTLYGEAFFDVTRDERKPFIIKTKDVEVQVLGTSFNVRSYPEDEGSIVAVATGKVSVSDGQAGKSLLPGERISYREAGGLSPVGKFDRETEFAWRDNILLFEGRNLEEVVKILARWYGMEFHVVSQTVDRQKKFSGRYNNPSLRVALEGLCYVYHMDYEIDHNNKKVILR